MKIYRDVLLPLRYLLILSQGLNLRMTKRLDLPIFSDSFSFSSSTESLTFLFSSACRHYYQYPRRTWPFMKIKTESRT